MKTYQYKKKIMKHNRREQVRKRGTKELQDRQKIINKMAIVSPSLSIITLNVNGG